MTTAAIKNALRTKYGPKEWAIMFEVRDAAGFAGNRSADAVAMNLWPSRGLAVHGFEVKVSRSDWQRELAAPEKSAAIQQFCDHWWIVTTPGIVKAGELPPTWGLQELHSGKLVVKVEAPKLVAAPLTRGFMACMLRRASEVDADEVKTAVDAQVAAMRGDDEKRIEKLVERRTHRSGEILGKLEAIKAATGVDLEHWEPVENVAAAIRLMLTGRLTSKHSGALQLAKDMASAAVEIKALFDAVGDGP